MRWISGIIDRLLAVAGALILSQAPLYMLQYEHQLAGHVKELQLLTNQLSRAAQQTGKSLPEYEHYFLNHADEVIASQGQIIENVIQRKQSLETTHRLLQESGIWSRPFVFLYHLNLPIAKETLTSFQPGILMNFEGFLYALIGMSIGYMFFMGIYWITSLFYRKTKKFTIEQGE